MNPKMMLLVFEVVWSDDMPSVKNGEANVPLPSPPKKLMPLNQDLGQAPPPSINKYKNV